MIWPFRVLPAHPLCFKPHPGVAVDALLSLTWQIPSVLQPVCIWDLLELSTSFCAHCHPSSRHHPLPGTDSTEPAQKLSSPSLTARSPLCDQKGLSDCLAGHFHRLRGEGGGAAYRSPQACASWPAVIGRLLRLPSLLPHTSQLIRKAGPAPQGLSLAFLFKVPSFSP